MKCYVSLGFSLVEVMIASLLAALLLAGLVEVYITIKSSYEVQQALSTVQENARFANFLFNRIVQVAGEASCENKAELVNQKQAIEGYDAQLPAVLRGQAVKGSDVLMIGECTRYKNKEQFIQRYYYIADTHRKNLQNKEIYALYMKGTSGRREELIPGISKMKILYGLLDQNKHILLGYFPASAVSNWQKVVSIKLYLLLNSIDNTVKKSPRYWFINQWMMPKDRLLYKSWPMTINLRERIVYND